MELTGKRVFNLARLRQTPREIEIILGLPPYRIHETYHRELMSGYLEAESVSPANDSDSDKQEKTDSRRRFYYEANREKIRERKRRYYETHKEEYQERKRRYRERRKNQGVLKIGN